VQVAPDVEHRGARRELQHGGARGIQCRHPEVLLRGDRALAVMVLDQLGERPVLDLERLDALEQFRVEQDFLQQGRTLAGLAQALQEQRGPAGEGVACPLVRDDRAGAGEQADARLDPAGAEARVRARHREQIQAPAALPRIVAMLGG
jgi:hypothetical protein